MLKEGKGSFDRIRNSRVRATGQNLSPPLKGPLQNRKTQILFRIEKVVETAFGQLGILANRIYRGRPVTASQKQLLRRSKNALSGLIRCHDQSVY